jgi:hypothetical protein
MFRSHSAPLIRYLTFGDRLKKKLIGCIIIFSQCASVQPMPKKSGQIDWLGNSDWDRFKVYVSRSFKPLFVYAATTAVEIKRNKYIFGYRKKHC